MRTTTMLALALAGGLALPAAASAQQQDTTHKPITPATVTTATGKEAERVGKRTEKATKKAAKQTAKQGKRSAHGVKKIYSRKARKGDDAKKDSSKTP